MQKRIGKNKIAQAQGDCEVTGEVFESTASLLKKKKVLSFIKNNIKTSSNLPVPLNNLRHLQIKCNDSVNNKHLKVK